MNSVTATLGGFTLLGSSTVEWPTRSGIRPVEQTFDMIPSDAAALVKVRAPVDLVIKYGNTTRTVKNLWVNSVYPGENEFIAKIQVNDRRWMLDYMHFLRRYNMRRNVGFQRVGQNAQDVLNPVTPKVWYWKWSLRNPEAAPPDAKWQPSQVLDDMLGAINEFERAFAGRAPGYTIKDNIKKTDRKLSVESMVLDDSGGTCLLRSLALFPEADIFVDDDGKYVVFSRIDGAEGVAAKLLGPEVIGGGHLQLVSNDRTRPQDVDVRFTPEIEMRLDYIETADGATVTTTTTDKRQLKNVVSVPDYFVTIDGQTYVQHSYVDVDKLFTATEWQSPPNVGGGRITHRFLERAAIPYLDLWGKLLLTGTRQPDADWASRVGALNHDWRKTFQVEPRLMDRILTIKARRVGVIDPVNGIAAPSAAWCDHSFIGTVRSFFKNIQGTNTLEYAINVPGYPTGAQVPGQSAPAGALSFDTEIKAATAVVSVIDPDQGIIRVELGPDKNHMYEAALPGLIVRADGSVYVPTADARNPRKGAVTFDSVVTRGQVPKLSGSWKMCTIVTIIPAAPNDERQLFSIKIQPKDVQDLLPQQARDSLKNCFGPTWQVRVGPGLDGARAIVRWSDGRAPDIEAVLGLSDAVPDLEGLVLNAKNAVNTADGLQAASLNEIARAIAAAIYARFTDHLEGSATGTLMPNSPVFPFGGWMEERVDKVGTKGEVQTEIKMSKDRVDFNLMAYLDNSTRALLMRQPHPDK